VLGDPSLLSWWSPRRRWAAQPAGPSKSGGVDQDRHPAYHGERDRRSDARPARPPEQRHFVDRVEHDPGLVDVIVALEPGQKTKPSALA
jgi:hypothetical protein